MQKMKTSKIMSTNKRSVGEKVRSELCCAAVQSLPWNQSDRSLAAFFLGEGAKTKEERRLVQKIGESDLAIHAFSGCYFVSD